MFPILLNLTGRTAVVVGGGAVGLRKIVALTEGEAAVRLIDPRPLPELPTGVIHVEQAYRPDHLDGASLAFACATPEVNSRVVSDARERGVRVNSASNPADGDFVLPSVLRIGALTLGISTSGAAPALARRIREKLALEYDQAFAQWVDVLAVVRDEVMATIPDPDRRRTLLNSFADWPWLARLRVEGSQAVLAAMREQLR